MKVSLLITTYNNVDSLLAVLRSVQMQTRLPLEVIVADDGSSDGTAEALHALSKTFPVPLIHAFQDDKGFRASRVRNLGVRASKGDYIVMIDGDIYLDQRFIENHIENAEKGMIVQGQRVKMRNPLSLRVKFGSVIPGFFSHGIKDLRHRKHAIHSKVLSKALTTVRSDDKWIRSCNMGMWKADYVALNGFNNAFEGWGREDTDFANRALFHGLKVKHVRCGCIGYHLWHQECSRDRLSVNDELLKQTLRSKQAVCEHGYLQTEI